MLEAASNLLHHTQPKFLYIFFVGVRYLFRLLQFLLFILFFSLIILDSHNDVYYQHHIRG
jgi:hypothetical protein